VRAQTVDELKEALTFAKKENLSFFILGGGSNILVRDEGFDGLVIKIEIQGIEIEEEESDAKKIITAGAGESWDALVEKAVEEKLWGVENLSGIPGTVGGAVAGNIGAYGQALSQTLVWAEVLDTATNEIKKISNADCAFGYRESAFSNRGKVLSSGDMNGSPTPPERTLPRFVVLRAAFALSRVPKPDVSYKDLAALFNDSSSDIKAIRQAVLNIRKGKFPDLAVEGTAGSFFKNPVLPAAEAEVLQARYPAMPLFVLPESVNIKIPLGWLLDYRHGVIDARAFAAGGACMYEKQFLVIVAQKNCTANDVRTLAARVQREVKEKIGIEIEPEVKILL
jgi:UDP-N-acetylmuramate dehydrogenase